MRVDKYLWCMRKFKTRSLASEACRKNKVMVNDEESKASKDLKGNDIISLKKDNIVYKYRVIAFPKSRVGAKLVDEYVKDITSTEELDKLEFLKLMKGFNREKGAGRPTKKDRRDIDKLHQEDE